MQEQVGEEQKKTSSSYLFSYYNEWVDSISKWKTGTLAPSFWGTGLTQGVYTLFFLKGKPTNPATQTHTKNTIFKNYFNVESHMVEWFHNHQNIKLEIKTVRFQKTDICSERDIWRLQGSYCCRDVKNDVCSDKAMREACIRSHLSQQLKQKQLLVISHPSIQGFIQLPTSESKVS